jgi:GTP-binding protein EngB required for normal cell division
MVKRIIIDYKENTESDDDFGKSENVKNRPKPIFIFQIFDIKDNKEAKDQYYITWIKEYAVYIIVIIKKGKQNAITSRKGNTDSSSNNKYTIYFHNSKTLKRFMKFIQSLRTAKH